MLDNKQNLLRFFFVLVLAASMMTACQTENQDQGDARNIIKKYYHETPVLKLKEIAYKDEIEKKAAFGISYEQWQHILNDKLLFIYPDKKFVLFERPNKIPSDIRDKEQTAAYVLGKIKLTDEIDGLVVLESGYYSLTLITIYPVDAQGNSWAGIEVADWFADENEEVKIASIITKDKTGIKVITTVTMIIYEEPEIPSTQENAQKTIRLKDTKKFAWGFDPMNGFILEDK